MCIIMEKYFILYLIHIFNDVIIFYLFFLRSCTTLSILEKYQFLYYLEKFCERKKSNEQLSCAFFISREIK